MNHLHFLLFYPDFIFVFKKFIYNDFLAFSKMKCCFPNEYKSGEGEGEMIEESIKKEGWLVMIVTAAAEMVKGVGRSYGGRERNNKKKIFKNRLLCFSNARYMCYTLSMSCQRKVFNRYSF